MWVFRDLQSKPKALANILERIKNPRSEHKAFLVLLHQFLDMHEANIGTSPVIDDNFQFMDQYLFNIIDIMSTKIEPISLFELLQKYLNKEVHDTTWLYILGPETEIISIIRISDCDRLWSALNTPWELQIFDGDNVIGEDENLAIYSWRDRKIHRERKTFTILPLRNFLLQVSPFKDSPLSQTALHLIKETLKDEKLDDWCLNKHNFPWRFINRKNHDDLQKLILEKIRRPEYTLSYHSQQGININIEILSRMIAEDLSDVSVHFDFWQSIQAMFLEYGEKGWFKTQTNDSVVRTDLTVDTSEAKRQRIIIAQALLPQETWRQRQARLNRTENCQKFLNFYEQLIFLNKCNDLKIILLTIHQILSNPVIPFSTEKKIKLLKNINQLLNASNLTEGEVRTFLNSMIVEYTPTYEKLASAMYPFLADVHALIALNLRSYSLNNNFHSMLGKQIGNYAFPIEDIINNARQQFLHFPDIIDTINQIQRRIEEELERQKNEFGAVSYFGWVFSANVE